ncbi:MAG: hypothetical protein SangKO_061540 [Sandaracinaceae bacterium]
MSFRNIIVAGALLGAVGCGQGTGGATVLLEAEDTITGGIPAGSSGEAIQDGWSVTFDDYVVVIGDVDLHLATDETVEAEAGELFAVDLVDVSESGLALWDFEGLETGRWELFYRVGGAADGAMRDPSVTEAQFSEMQAGDWTYLVAGTIDQDGGQSCPPASIGAELRADATPNGSVSAGGDACYDATSVRFRWGVTAETSYGPCEIDEVPGFAVAAGGVSTVALTIHGDHIFFNGFPEGGEGGVQRLAQWLADSDLNLDGEVTREELEQIAPSDLPELDDRYQLGGAPIPIDASMWAYVTAQLKTQGHFQGEGECPVDGVAHEH